MCSCLENIERIARPEYVPSPMDVIQTRVRSTGIYDMTFTIGTTNFR
jgi:hypothetical protein